MRWLEHRIPPPVVALLVGVGMWLLAGVSLRLSISFPVRLALSLTWALLGIGVAVLGATAFRRAKTTTNPLRPDAASSLVVAGVFHHTRNPMYLGLSMVLIGWAIYLAAPWTLLGPPLFVAYITRFQILPEERALAQNFGQGFTDYCTQVRRWI